jgi:hypothetical protein
MLNAIPGFAKYASVRNEVFTDGRFPCSAKSFMRISAQAKKRTHP